MERLKPAPNGVNALVWLAPECADYRLDELACEIVQWAVKKRAVKEKQY